MALLYQTAYLAGAAFSGRKFRRILRKVRLSREQVFAKAPFFGCYLTQYVLFYPPSHSIRNRLNASADYPPKHLLYYVLIAKADCVTKITMIAENLKAVTQRISMSCEKSGRPADAVKLVCVTKEASLAQIEEVLALGVRSIGENRVRDALAKYQAIGGRAIWHLIGHLQTNKVRDAVGISLLIHSVDSIRLAKEIDREAKKAGKIQDILIQVNTSGEESKFGLAPDAVEAFFREICPYPNINISGLMTIAPEVDDPEKTRPYFRKLRGLRDELQNLQLTTYNLQLSMGMTNDFEVAIEEGATMVRIGRAIFKDDQ